MIRRFLFLLVAAITLTGCATTAPPEDVPGPAPDAEPSASAASSPEAATAQWLEAHRDRRPLLRDFLARMPKGGDLHTHLSGAVYAESYLQWAAEQNLCARPDPGAITSCPADVPTDSVAGVVPMDSVLTTHWLYDDLVDALSIRNLEVRGVTGREQFFATFGRFGEVYRDRPRRAGDALAELLRRAAAQNVHHVEPILFDALRVGSGDRVVDSLAATVSYTDDWAELRSRLMEAGMPSIVDEGTAFLDRMEARADSLLGCGSATPEPGCDVTRRYRMHAIRVFPPTTVFARLLYGIQRAHSDPRVKAIDMVAPEDDRVALRDYDRHLRMLRFLRRAAGTDAAGDSVDVGLHAGELTMGLVPPEHLRDHVRQAVTVAEADRIGHAVDVGYETDTQGLLQMMRERGVAVEVCLTSNDVILGVTGDEHPLPTFLDAGVPVVLATDDEGVSRIDLTHEYVRAATTYGLDYPTLKTISRNSLHFSFLDGASLWQSRDYARYAPACRGADPSTPSVPSSCQSFLDANPRAAAEWRLETAFDRFEQSFVE
jgi:adenosine deaminase/adenosine deaminase CECR1